jgi:excisionase family DNA binding protein
LTIEQSLQSRVLIPYDVAEAISVKEAAAIAGLSVRTVRRWCDERGIGRQIVPGGSWRVSRPALSMLLDGDERALHGYRAGFRGQFEPVAAHFRKVGLAHLLELAAFTSVRPSSQQ